MTEASSGATSVATDAAGPVAACDGAAECERTVFVTSVRYPADFGGVAGAEAHCNDLARTSSHPLVRGRRFAAWVCATTVESWPSARLVKGTRRYVRPDGQRVADDWATLASPSHRGPIDLDETGTVVATGDVWTGCVEDGTATSASCGGWTTPRNGLGTIGSATSASASWSNTQDVLCTQLARLYCIEQ